MIYLKWLSGKQFVLNCDVIKYIEATPDTVITLTTGEKIMVKDRVEEVVHLTMEYRRRVLNEPPAHAKSGKSLGAHSGNLENESGAV